MHLLRGDLRYFKTHYMLVITVYFLWFYWFLWHWCWDEQPPRLRLSKLLMFASNKYFLNRGLHKQTRKLLHQLFHEERLTFICWRLRNIHLSDDNIHIFVDVTSFFLYIIVTLTNLLLTTDTNNHVTRQVTLVEQTLSTFSEYLGLLSSLQICET